MDITKGLSYSNGFDIWVKKDKNVTVFNAIMEENGKRSVVINGDSRRKVVKNTIIKTICILIFSVIMSLFYNLLKGNLEDKHIRIVIVATIWFFVYVYALIYSLSKKNLSTCRFHAVEHMVITYFFSHIYPPASVDELKKENKYYIGCGSTLLVLIGLIVSFYYIIIPFLACNIFLKILIVAGGSIIFGLMWLSDKFNFIQKKFVKTPTDEEVALGVLALREIYKMKDPNPNYCIY